MEPITFTDVAVEQLKSIIAEQGVDDLKLRMFIQGGGCSGFQYGFTFETDVQEDDFVYQRDGIQVLIDSMSYQYLVGSTVNFTEDINGSQFDIKNPNATTTCGCGSSFSA